jgi:hypothetical protein
MNVPRGLVVASGDTDKCLDPTRPGVGIAGAPLGQLDLVNIVHATVSVAVRQNRQDEENEIFSRAFQK